MLTIFNFTFRQNTKGKGFIFVTFILPIIICALCILACVLMASDDGDDEYKSPIKNVYVDNRTALTYMDFGNFAQMSGEEYSDVQFIMADLLPEDDANGVLAVLNENEDEYSINISRTTASEISKSELSDFSDCFAEYVEQLRTIDAVIKSNGGTATEEQVMTALMPVGIEHITEGNEVVGLGAVLIQMIGPLVIVLIMYMMILMYGQTIGNIIISEKVSKLMETLLVSVRPNNLITGKILAIVVIAIIQIVMWVIGVVMGFVIGDIVAGNINPDYTNVVFEAVDLIREAGKDLAFTLPVIILSVLAVIIGFTFYCILSGLIASPVSKAEELATSYGTFQIVVIIAFLVSYMLPLQGVDGVINTVLYIVPLTGAFMLPGAILLGNVSFAAGLGYIALLIAFTVAVAYYAGKLYRNQLFYNSVSGSFLKKIFR